MCRGVVRIFSYWLACAGWNVRTRCQVSTDTKMLQLPAAALVICVYASLRHNDISSGKQNNLTICQNNYLLLLHCLDYLFMNDLQKCIKGTRKKSGKFHIQGGGSGPGHFPHLKKKWCLKCILSHFKLFQTMFFWPPAPDLQSKRGVQTLMWNFPHFFLRVP